MLRKIFVGIALIFLGFMAMTNYPDVQYHLTWEQVDKLADIKLEDVLENPEYIIGIEKAVGSTKIWGEMTKEQKQKFIDNCHFQSMLILGAFVIASIMVFTIPVGKRRRDDVKQ